MNAEINFKPRKLRILHIFRAPLGGLFRHVVDLAREQTARGHDVGMFFDTPSRNERVDAALSQIEGGLSLGVSGCPIHRNPHPSDIGALARLAKTVAQVKPDVLHGHGSKGGLYARLPGLLHPRSGPIRAYTPHGGSFNYAPGGAAHRAFMATEKLLALSTDVFLFESAYIAACFDAFVGVKHGSRRVVLNGIRPSEFIPVSPNPDATEFVYVGELRAAKGIDTLLDALAFAKSQLGRTLRATLVGLGPDKDMLIAKAKSLGLANSIVFPGPQPARQAFALGRIMVAPSRAKSLPYIVLEAAAAQIPLISTHVGGIPEIFGPYRDRLGPSDDPRDLCRRMLAMLDRGLDERRKEAAELAAFVEAHFSIRTMIDAVMEGYAEAMARRAQGYGAAELSKIPSNA